VGRGSYSGCLGEIYLRRSLVVRTVLRSAKHPRVSAPANAGSTFAPRLDILPIHINFILKIIQPKYSDLLIATS
jgi:hypothetical protein